MQLNNKPPKITKIPTTLSSAIQRLDLPRYFLLVATILVALLFGLIQPKFLNPENLANILCTSALVGTMAIAAFIPMAAGEMNFAIGTQATLAAVIVGVMMDLNAVPYGIAFLSGLAVSLLIGLFASYIILKIGAPSFIATLSISTFASGLVVLLTNNKVMFSTNWTKSFTYLGQGYIGPIPILVIVFILIVLVSWVLLDKTRIGIHIFAVGNNPTAARQGGININKIKLISFLISSVLAGIAGILSASRDFNVRPSLGGDMLMNSIAIAMLGATFLRPGRFNVQGTLVAALLIVIIQNGIISIGAPIATQYVIEGVIFLFSVGFIALTRKGGLPGVSFGK